MLLLSVESISSKFYLYALVQWLCLNESLNISQCKKLRNAVVDRGRSERRMHGRRKLPSPWLNTGSKVNRVTRSVS
jgi:hypothetical protein